MFKKTFDNNQTNISGGLTEVKVVQWRGKFFIVFLVILKWNCHVMSKLMSSEWSEIAQSCPTLCNPMAEQRNIKGKGVVGIANSALYQLWGYRCIVHFKEAQFSLPEGGDEKQSFPFGNNLWYVIYWSNRFEQKSVKSKRQSEVSLLFEDLNTLLLKISNGVTWLGLSFRRTLAALGQMTRIWRGWREGREAMRAVGMGVVA